VGQLARVLTRENEAEVLPRFFGRSAREAAELAAELLPRAEPPMRALVTPLAAPRPASLPIPRPMEGPQPSLVDLAQHALAPCQGLSVDAPHPTALPPAPLHTYEVPVPDRVAPPRQDPPRPAEIEPLTAELRRLHLTVSKGFLQKVATARTGLSHALPRATTEQILEAALDLLLERQARRKARVKRPRRTGKASTPTPTSSGRPHIPAEIEREVRLRDGDRCQFPLDVGGVCGSTWQVELDHVVPLALWGPTIAANLRCACAAHNRYAAELLLGAASASIRRRKARPCRTASSPQVGGGA
jgi:5-methylcytosine-specific restriction endonuclease McrA